jgi:acyl carrier protein
MSLVTNPNPPLKRGTVSIRSTIISEIERIAAEEGKTLPALADDTVLLDLSGLDSLAIAVLVARLEETLGLDPFTQSDDISYPVTLGDFIKSYEKAGPAS